MRRICACLLALALLCTVCACNRPAEDQTPESGGPSWQEQYDLGLRYLSEGKYEEAILAFTAAIEIDPKRAPAYVGRADTYVLLGDTEENLTAARLDYEKAVELDELLAEAYLGLADVYIRQGDYDKALEILRQGLEKVGENEELSNKIAEMEGGNISDRSGKVRRETTYDMDGNILRYIDFNYDEKGRQCSWHIYHQTEMAEGDTYCEVTFNEFDEPEKYEFYDANGNLTGYDAFVYDGQRRQTGQWRYNPDGSEQAHFAFYYNEQGQCIRYDSYDPDGTMINYWISEYDENGNFLREVCYDAKTNTPTDYTVSD